MKQEPQTSKMYFLAIVLPAPFDEKLRRYKKWMQEKWSCNVGLKSPAHITIIPPFWMPEEKEEALREDMEKLAGQVPPFVLTTDNFSAFRPRTIFVAVQPNAVLSQLKKLSADAFHPLDYGLKIETRPFHPHVTIATRDLHKKDFAEAWPYFEKETCIETLPVDGLSLLRHNSRTWDVVFTAPFTATLPAVAAGPL